MQLDLQIATAFDTLPSESHFVSWCEAALATVQHDMQVEVTVRLVDNPEIQQLNHDYRGKNRPTNVLSFPFEPVAFDNIELLGAYAGDCAQLELPVLGDIVIAPAVIAQEATEQGKTIMAHFAHMTVHGVLHLLGYDHIDDEQADTMETLEINILHNLGIGNPYDV